MHIASTSRLISVVVPIHNEIENIPLLYKETVAALQGCNFEIIFCDDGSFDGSAPLLDEIAMQDPHIRIIHFRRNFGQTAAMSAGFAHARGDVVVAMDGDLQNDPRDIRKLVAEIDKGFDLVSGWRKNRKDKALSRKLPSLLANRLIGWITGVKIHDYGCTLKAYRRDLLQHVDLYGEMHRFIPAIARGVGAKITEIVVEHRPRTFGQTKYGISRTFRVVLDLLTIKFFMRFQTRPLHFIGIPGLISMFTGSILFGYLLVVKLVLHEPIGNRPLLTISILLILAGAQFFGLGLIAEYLTRIYYGISNRNPYIVDRIVEAKGIQKI